MSIQLSEPSPADDRLIAQAELMSRRRGGRTVACAESFTSGLLSQSIAAAEGSSKWFLGGVVTYMTEAKRSVLGVTSGRVVHEQAAQEMALGAARLFGVDAAVATTGVAGPDELEGNPPGTVVIGWAVDGRAGSSVHYFAGPPSEVVRRGVSAALTQLAAALGDVEESAAATN